MWWLLLLAYVAGVLMSLGMLAARLSSGRVLVLRPAAMGPLFVVCWPVAWLVGFGVLLIVLWALAGTELARRGGSK